MGVDTRIFTDYNPHAWKRKGLKVLKIIW